MLEFFDRLYSLVRKHGLISSVTRLTIRTIAQILVPLGFRLRKGAIKTGPTEKDLIVSLTTFPGRIKSVWIVIECMLRQKVKADKIILWLSVEQFPERNKSLPSSLLRYVIQDTLDIRYVDGDLKSHKKYYYAFKEFPHSKIVTIDDDLFYPNNLIEDLLKYHYLYPDVICCHRGYFTQKTNSGLDSYKSWKKTYDEYGPTAVIFHTSGGGTLYKPSFFTDEVTNEEAFKKLSFYADDVWLNIMAQMRGTKTIKTDFYTHYIPINVESSFKLSKGNVSDNGNDRQITNIINHYKLNEHELFQDTY